MFKFVLPKLTPYYSKFGISFPEESFSNCTPGTIKKNGWHIFWNFGIDSHGHYLFLYASHRHPGLSIDKWWADGTESTFQQIIDSCHFTQEQLETHKNDHYSLINDILNYYNTAQTEDIND